MEKKRSFGKWALGTVILLILVLGWVGIKFILRPETELVPLQRRDITEAIYALGKVKSTIHYDVKVGVLTNLRDLYVQEGQQVQVGQKLLKFEDSNIFFSPIEGVVTKVNNYPGEIVTPQASVLRVDNLSKKYIEVILEQQGALRVKAGQKARIDFETIRSNPLNAKVITLFSRDDEFIAQLDVENLPSSILPGMTADVVIEIGSKPNALVVPVSAVQDGRVTVSKGNKKIKVALEIGVIDGEWAEVISGDLKDDDKIVLRKKTVGGP